VVIGAIGTLEIEKMYNMDLFFLQQMMGNGRHLPMVVLIGGLFLVLAFRREAIVQVSLFRLGVVLVAASMAISPILQVMQIESYSSRGQGLQTGNLVLSSLGPVLQSAALVCIVFSMLPTNPKTKPESSIGVAKKHALDD
jgi:hypothetical protein